MAQRHSPGGVVEGMTKTRGRSFGIRFRAGGKRRFQLVGYEADGVTRADAERELRYVVEQVRRGEWAEPREPEPIREAPTFYEAAAAWFEGRLTEGGRRGQGLSERGEADLRWRIDKHLTPAFHRKRVDEITVADVDAFRRRKVSEGLSATSVNKLIACLAAILEECVEHEHIDRNVARGRRRKLPATPPNRTLIDWPEGIATLLDAATELDREGKQRGAPYRRALLSLLIFGGLRIGEARALRWEDVHLGSGQITVRGTKTDAAERVVEILPALRDDLAAHAARRPSDDPAAYVFATRTGRPRGATNIRRRCLQPAVERANERLRALDVQRLPHLTPHSLRRTFASLLYALDKSPAHVMAQMGHSSPNLALAVYAKAMRLGPGDKARLKALVEGRDWAPAGSSAAGEAEPAPDHAESESPQTAL